MQTQRKKKDFWPLIVGTIAAIGIIGSNSTGGITKTPRPEETTPTSVAAASVPAGPDSTTAGTMAGETTVLATLPSVTASGQTGALRLDRATEAVKAGEVASIGIVGQPGVTYDIVIALGGSAGGVSGMEPKQADASGRVDWQWRVPILSTRGSYTVTISGGGARIETRLTVD